MLKERCQRGTDSRAKRKTKTMKLVKAVTLVGAFGILISSAAAQSGPGGNGSGAGGTNGSAVASGPQYKRQATPAEVQAQLQQFKRERETFMAKQAELEQKLKTASDQDLDRLLQQMRDQMEQFKQEQTRIQEQLCDQADRQRTQLRDHTRILDRTSNPGTTPTLGGPGTDGTKTRGR